MNVTTGDEPNGFCFVAAGEPWLGPHKVTPAYPGYELGVPAIDEYVVGGDADCPVLTHTCDPWVLTNFNAGSYPWYAMRHVVRRRVMQPHCP